MNVDNLVDTFVTRINQSRREPEFADEVPESVRLGEPDEYGVCDWQIRPYSSIDWIEDLEAKLSKRLPRSFRSLATRYIFPILDLGKITLWANTPDRSVHQLRNWAVKRDFWDLLLDAGYIPFGCPEIENIDPVCFDTNGVKSGNEYPIVRFYHEELWIYNRVRIDENYEMTFVDLMKSVVERNDG